jgi:anti-sigma B factor antagonist
VHAFKVTHRSTSQCCEVIELAGELDFATAPDLEAVLDRMMVIPRHIIIDATHLTFIDSTGLRLLLRASALVQGCIWVKEASRQILRIIDVTGVSELFCLEQDPVSAHRTMETRRAGLAVTA